MASATKRDAMARAQSNGKGRASGAPRAPTRPIREPVRLTSGSDGAAADERITLFYIDDAEYTMPVRVGVNVALKFLHTARKADEAVAMAELLETVLGEKAYTALMNHEGLGARDLGQIMTIVSDHVFGELEGAAGN